MMKKMTLMMCFELLIFFFLSHTKAIADTLKVDITFTQSQYVPAVIIVYWPEDTSLNQNAIMDHRDGHFTEKLIVAPQGSQLILRNNDDVGHTIYVKDKRQGVQWRLDYMPPNSEYTQTLFWPDDVFVELRCRLHLYMSSWAGSLASRYYKIMTLDQEQLQFTLYMTDIPQKFTKVKIWMPKYKLIKTRIEQGLSQALTIEKKQIVRAELLLTRF